MQPPPALQSLRSKWREHCAPRLDAALEKLLNQVDDRIRAERPGQTTLSSELTPLVTTETHAVVEQLGNVVHDWLIAQNCWPKNTPADWLRNDLRAAAVELPSPPDVESRIELEVPTRSWVIAAGVGAAAGMTLLTPLSLLLFGQREIGLGLGGILGSIGCVTLVGVLAGREKVRQVLAAALTASAVGTFAGGLWTALRGGSNDLLKGSFGLGLLAAILYLTRPRQTTRVDREAVRRAVRAHWEHVADLILAWAWAYAARQPASGAKSQGDRSLPSGARDALAELYIDLANGTSPENLRDMVDVVFQQLRTEGYRWELVPAGAPFDESLLARFEVVGLISAGQPVRTRRAALLVNECVVKKGELRRV
ncbi:MAG: hypothetical protein MUF18_01825 [Fimbriiglobus sp.]|nr:hypothetical protein [Fimbriiglobus sp.]